MSISYRTKKWTFESIEARFPRSVSLRWNSKRVVDVHFFGRDDETFCCIEGVWWKYIARDTGWMYHGEFEDEWVPNTEMDFLQCVNPPADVIYDASVVVDYSNEPFVSTNKSAVQELILFLITYH